MHKAREEFVKLETSEKLRRAMRAKTRTHNNIRYLPGEEVFFKRENESRWKGPGRVIGQDGSKVLVKTPNSLISVHSSRVILTSKSEQDRIVENTEIEDPCIHINNQIDNDLVPNVRPEISTNPPDQAQVADSNNQDEIQTLAQNHNSNIQV